MTVSTMLQTAGQMTKENAPHIFTALGLAGFVTSIGFAIKATPKAKLLIDEAIREKAIESDTPEEDVKLTPLEMVKTTAVVYAPTVIMAFISAALIVSADHISTRRYTATAAAYELGRQSLELFQEKALEQIGEEKVEEIHKAIAQERMKNAEPIPEQTVIVAGDAGKVLCFDGTFGHYFHSDMASIKTAIAEINNIINEQQFASVNEFYGLIGSPELPEMAVADDIGWTDRFKVKITTMLADNDAYRNIPCIALNYDVEPYYNRQYR